MRPEVKLFLDSLRNYLYGDLKTFRKICDEIEAEENREKKTAIPHVTESNSAGTPGISRSVTYETTSPSGNAGTSGYETLNQKHIGVYRSTIPHALAVLAAIDILGYLISSEPNAGATARNIEKFLAGKVTNQDQLNCLVFIYRHGMSHSFFPKGKIAIAAHSSLEGKELFYRDSNDLITLNVNALISIMVDKFDKIMADTSIHGNIETQFDKLEAEDQQKLIDRYHLDLGSFAMSLKRIDEL